MRHANNSFKFGRTASGSDAQKTARRLFQSLNAYNE